jgi:hypothetical protein
LLACVLTVKGERASQSGKSGNSKHQSARR